jgi:formylglycine-generating enzyme
MLRSTYRRLMVAGLLVGIVTGVGLAEERSIPRSTPPSLLRHGLVSRATAHARLLVVAAKRADARSSSPPLPPLVDRPATTVDEQRKWLLRNMKEQLRLPDSVMGRVRDIIEGSRAIGQGNPAISRYALSRRECLARRRGSPVTSGDEEVCGAPNMVALFRTSVGETEREARVCIDQFEFPNIPCEYPVVWVQAREAHLLCQALKKRLCDAHEWEGACAGDLRPIQTEYAWGEPRLKMEWLHNKAREVVWAYGPEPDDSACATASAKSPRCFAGGWERCGSNTYPAGSFPRCVSLFGVYDLHGNVAEHMSLPLSAEELASRGGLGQTEMKGSWFAFNRHRPHADDCRWRARNWHGSAIDDPGSHRNYHLGFRCCKNAGQSSPPARVDGTTHE